MKRTPTIQPGAWLYREAPRIERDGRRMVSHYRRQITAVDATKIRLGPMERCDCPAGVEPADWAPHGGLLGGPADTSAERLQALMQAQGWRLSRAAR